MSKPVLSAGAAPADARPQPAPEEFRHQRRRTPLCTYRLQLHHQFRFADAVRILPYLERLGVTDCYTSPMFKAKPGSLHGYDITDHNTLNPELGTEDDYNAFAAALAASGMGHLLDFVPNHMGIDPVHNPWWRDVLENGPSSPFANYFDIDWSPVKPELKDKVLLPILGEPYGAALERGALRLAFENGTLLLHYGDQTLPVNPRRIPDVLKLGLGDLERDLKDGTELREFLSILTELSNLPSNTDQNAARIEERQREKEVARERLARLAASSLRLHQHIQDSIRAFNGEPGKTDSFNALHLFLEAQAYRLAYWKTASHEINYRRFFDINQLAGLRMERPEVFEATHRRLLALLADGKILGLRLDHPDGLYDPQRYFEALQKTRPLYVVAEKILSAGESLRRTWPLDGTSGYDFLNLVNHLWIEPRHKDRMKEIYERFAGRALDTEDVVYRSKKLIMSTSMASELNVLAHLLNDISESRRLWRDFTLESLRDALREVVACFPVYRTYVNGPMISPSDELIVTKAVAMAKQLNPATESSVFDFVREMLLPQKTPGLAEHDYERRLAFAMKFQQYTAPVQAKGVEDTAFYRYHMLVSLNEVGGDLQRFGISISDFHKANSDRQRDRPYALLATTTHDTKRGEDARARLNVLSEIPDEWEREVTRWTRLTRPYKTLLNDRAAPDANDEYLFYQSLLGAWDLSASSGDLSGLRVRLQDYMIKATREGKRHTSWIRPNEDYEQALHHFVGQSLTHRDPESFLAAFEPFCRRVAAAGMMNSLSQLALKAASPGVPDFYQGTELWDWNLVDPDNRRPVNYERRGRLLDELDPLCSPVSPSNEEARQAALQALLRDWPDGRIKLFVTAMALRFRKSHADLFLKGTYSPLKVTGDLADHLVAFSRENGEQRIMVVAPRLLAPYGGQNIPWGATQIEVPANPKGNFYRHIFTGGKISLSRNNNAWGLPASTLFQKFPIAWLSLENEA